MWCLYGGCRIQGLQGNLDVRDAEEKRSGSQQSAAGYPATRVACAVTLGLEIKMNDPELSLTIGACGEPCAHPPDEMKLSFEISRVAAELASLTNCRQKLADQAFRKFHIIRGIHLIWLSRRSRRLMLRLFKESKHLRDKAEKEMMKKVDSLLKKTNTTLPQPTGSGYRPPTAGSA